MDHAVKASVRKFALWPESTQTTNKFCLSYLIVRCCVCVCVYGLVYCAAINYLQAC